MSFEKEFPSLKDKEVAVGDESSMQGIDIETKEDFEKRSDGTVSWDKVGQYKLFEEEVIKENCLDKQRVWDAIGVVCDGRCNVAKELKKELGI